MTEFSTSLKTTMPAVVSYRLVIETNSLLSNLALTLQYVSITGNSHVENHLLCSSIDIDDAARVLSKCSHPKAHRANRFSQDTVLTGCHQM